MSDEVAFRSSEPTVIAAWDQWRDETAAIHEQRKEFKARFGGRDLWVNQAGFGNATVVVGLGRLDGEEPGDLVGDDGALRVPVHGPADVVPNLRRKAGRVLRDEMETLRTPDMVLPGMPLFSLVDHRMLRPGVLRWQADVWVTWSRAIPEAEVDAGLWTRAPLSAFYAAKEAWDAAEGRAS